MKGSTLAIGAIGGALNGFFDNQAQQNKEAKLQAENERLGQLLLMKEERITAREMQKEKSRQSFESGQKDKEISAKKEEGMAKRAAEVFDKGEDNEFEMSKLDKQHKNALALEGVKSGTKDTDKTKKSRDTLRERFEKEKQTRAKDTFGLDDTQTLEYDSWAKTTYPELYADAYPGGSSPVISNSGNGKSSKIDSIFSKVGASRTKQGANDGKQSGGDIIEPQPLDVNNLPSSLPQQGAGSPQVSSTGLPSGNSGQVETLPGVQAAPAKNAAVLEKALSFNPEGVNIGEIISLVEKGLLDVGQMSPASLVKLQAILQGKTDKGSRLLSEEVTAALNG